MTEAIKGLRAALGGISQEALARQVNLSAVAISRYERGEPVRYDLFPRFIRLARELELYDLAISISSHMLEAMPADLVDIVREAGAVQDIALLKEVRRRDPLRGSDPDEPFTLLRDEDLDLLKAIAEMIRQNDRRIRHIKLHVEDWQFHESERKKRETSQMKSAADPKKGTRRVVG